MYKYISHEKEKGKNMYKRCLMKSNSNNFLTLHIDVLETYLIYRV